LAKKAGITVQVNFRIMRRSFATANKNKLKDLQTVMGHSSIDMAGNVYAEGVEADAATMIQEFFDSIDAIAKSGKSRKRPPASLPTMKDAGKRMIQ
jgi:integrase